MTDVESWQDDFHGVCNFEHRTLSTIPKMRTGRRDRAISTGRGGSGDICHLAVDFITPGKTTLFRGPAIVADMTRLLLWQPMGGAYVKESS